MNARRAALGVVALGFTAFFGYIAIRGAHPQEVWDSLRDANAWWLIPSFVVLVLANLVRALRWQQLFAAETRPPLGPVTSASWRRSSRNTGSDACVSGL